MTNFLQYGCLLLLAQSAYSATSDLKVDLEILSKLYLPYTYTPTASYLPDKDAAEQMAYDASTHLLYSVGYPLTRKELTFETKKVLDLDGRKTPFKDNLPGKGWFKAFKARNPDLAERTPAALGYQRAGISLDMLKGATNVHVIDISDVTNLDVLYHTSLADVDATDVEVCGEFVFVANDNLTEREDGFVDVYRTFNIETNTLEHVQRIIVGDLPDMIQLTRDCSKLIVAIEAEPYDGTTSLIDNPGAVVIVTFRDTPAGSYDITTLDFTEFDSRISELEETGVRHIYRGNNNTFSNDVEPEYISLNKEETKAFIALQENNAIAVVDMVNERIEGVYGLGYKDWSDTVLDVSDKDGGIHLRPWSVLGMYQPDSIHVFRHAGIDYVITANEGDSKDYVHFTEEVRVSDHGLSEEFEGNATIRQILEQEDNLGRLKVTNINGFNTTTQKFDRLYAYGARGFSIFKADDMSLVYDSGSEIPNKMSLLHPNLFNNHLVPDLLASATMDTRSDDKGPETESVTMATIGDASLIFIGNERPGVVAVYSLDDGFPAVAPRFHTLLADIPRTNDTWTNLYNQRLISMIDAEDMRFIPAADSPNEKPLLLVTGSVSGTVTVVQINIQVDDDSNSAIVVSTSFIGTLAMSLAVSLVMFYS